MSNETTPATPATARVSLQAVLGLICLGAAFAVHRLWPAEVGLADYLMFLGYGFIGFAPPLPTPKLPPGGPTGTGLMAGLALGAFALIPPGCATAQRTAREVVDHRPEICAILEYFKAPPEVIAPFCEWPWPSLIPADPAHSPVTVEGVPEPGQ